MSGSTIKCCSVICIRNNGVRPGNRGIPEGKSWYLTDAAVLVKLLWSTKDNRGGLVKINEESPGSIGQNAG